MEQDIENILNGLTWGEVLKWEPCGGAVEYMEKELGLREETRFCSEYLKNVREYNSEWADWFLREAAYVIPGLTGEQRFDLVTGLEDEEEKYLAACDVPDLTKKQRRSLVSGLKDEDLRYDAARDVPDLTRKQRFSLVSGLENEYLRYKAAYNVPGLTEEQKEELRQERKT